MTDRELMDKAWDYLASYTVGERPNASEVNDLIFALESRLAQPERQWVGLTVKEIDHAAEQSDNYASFIAGALFAQDKLEEKNGG
jgi:hypothetical protein